MLLALAIFGLIVPNGLFIYFMLIEFIAPSQIFSNTLAVVFMLEAFILLALFTYYIWNQPQSPIKWYWFLTWSLIGSMAFSVPLYLWFLQRERIHLEIP